jgi:hypothetical protein
VSLSAEKEGRIFGAGFATGYQHGVGAGVLARELFEELRKPIPATDPKLLAPTRVRVLREFRAFNRTVFAGEELTIPRHEATGLAARGRVQIL